MTAPHPLTPLLAPNSVAIFGASNDPSRISGRSLRYFREAGYKGVGFSIGCGVTLDIAKTLVPGSPGEFFWGGAASTAFSPNRQGSRILWMQPMIWSLSVARRKSDSCLSGDGFSR